MVKISRVFEGKHHKERQWQKMSFKGRYGSQKTSRMGVDAETGEILWKHEFTNKISYYNEEKGYLLWVNKNGTRCFDDFELPKDLSDRQIAFLYRLSKHLYKNSNMLFYRSNNQIKALDTKSLSKLLGVNERRIKYFLTSMIKRRIIARAKVKIGEQEVVQYYLNPMFFFNGKYLNINLYLLFKSDLDHYLPRFILDIFNEKRKN